MSDGPPPREWLHPLDNERLRDILLQKPGWRRAATAGLSSRCGGAYESGVAILAEPGLGPRAQCCAETQPKTRRRT
jgi:hypothetical protein